MNDLERLARLSKSIRRRVVELAHSSKSGHIGSSMSCVDLLAGVYLSGRFRFQPADPDRDRFLLSKGHACVPYYACLQELGLLPKEHLDRYGEEGGELGHHPEQRPEWGIEWSTGSLGHGLSVSAGLALGAKLEGRSYRTIVLMSDGEQQEGTVWEAVMFAAQQRLDNLVAIVDFNKIQALGDTSTIIDLEPLDERYRSFGWGVRRIDGHDPRAIDEALAQLPFVPGRPSVIVADTVKGKGVSFMEGSLLWHYRPPSADEMAAALRELQDA